MVTKVIATVWMEGETKPTFILANGDVMSPVDTGTGSCWYLSWEKSTQLTAKVTEGVSGGGEPGYNIGLYKDGERIAGWSVAE